jgi:hypothetical protein
MTETGSPERIPEASSQDLLGPMWQAGLAKEAAAEVAKQMEHLRELDNRVIKIQLLSILLGFAALLILATLSCIFVLSGNPIQGSIVFGAGGFSIIGMFVGARSATLSIQKRIRGQLST